MRIMHNTWINNHRKTQSSADGATHRRDHRLAARRVAAARPLGDRSAEIEALEGLPDDEIVDAVEALPETLRMVVYYADVVGYRYLEIAEIMDTPIGTVMSRLHHARRRLRILLADVALQRGLSPGTRELVTTRFNDLVGQAVWVREQEFVSARHLHEPVQSQPTGHPWMPTPFAGWKRNVLAAKKIAPWCIQV